MPKILTPAMRAHLDEETTRLAVIWRITRKDGQQFFFTDHDRDIMFEGNNGLGATNTPFQTDLVNTLEVALVGGDAPESVTAEEMLEGANRAVVIRADGTAEVIHFQDVTATDAGTWVLSTLLRGRRGTEVYVSGHGPGEMFVMLDDSAAILRRLLPLDRVGKTLHLAAVARGGEAGNSKPQTIVLAGNDLKPYAPVHLAASGSFGTDITFSWVRRTRFGGHLQDGFGTVLLAEDTEEYEVEILGPDDDVRRTVAGLTSPTFTYTAVMQAEISPRAIRRQPSRSTRSAPKWARGLLEGSSSRTRRSSPRSARPSPRARPAVPPAPSRPIK